MKIDKEIWQKLKKVKILILDVDGVMTDGTLFWVENNGWTRRFFAPDGFGIQQVIKEGITVAILSGGQSKAIRERGAYLGIEHMYLGNTNKIEGYTDLKAALQAEDEQFAFMGDELFDLPVLQKVGLPVTVPNAQPEVKEIVPCITKNVGGHGAVREFTDVLLYSQKTKSFEEFCKNYPWLLKY